jgi:PII-like signaling protein
MISVVETPEKASEALPVLQEMMGSGVIAIY